MPNFFQEHILNQGREEEQVVDAPAFSITKVLGLGAVIIAPLATYVTEQLSEVELESAHYVAIVLGLLGFLAVTAAADVLARGIATAASKSAEVAEAQAKIVDARRARLMTFESPVAAHRRVAREPNKPNKRDVPIKLLALAGGQKPYLLAQEGDELNWLPEEDVTIP